MFSSTKMSRWGWSFCHCQTSRTHEGCSCSRLGREVAVLVFLELMDALWLSRLLSASADKTVQLWDIGDKLQKGFKKNQPVRALSKINHPQSKQLFAHRWLLADTSWRCQVFIHRMTDHHHCIEGNLSAAVLALGRLCELGWQCSGLESNRGDLHKVILKPRSGILLK